MKMTWIGALTLLLSAGAAQAADATVAGKAQQLCAACHGPDGNSASDQFPRLAGQREAYLAAALRGYRDGRRADPVMRQQAEKLSDREIGYLAAYYAAQTGLTVKQPAWGGCRQCKGW